MGRNEKVGRNENEDKNETRKLRSETRRRKGYLRKSMLSLVKKGEEGIYGK